MEHKNLIRGYSEFDVFHLFRIRAQFYVIGKKKWLNLYCNMEEEIANDKSLHEKG